MKWENTLTFKSSFLQRLLLDKTFTFTRLLQFVQNGGDAEIFKTNKTNKTSFFWVINRKEIGNICIENNLLIDSYL